MTTRHISGLQLARLLRDVPPERPYYLALARAVRALVLDGRLPLRLRLPAERDLATALGCSRTTITAAYDALRADGFMESRQGAGSWTVLPAGPMSSTASTAFGPAYTPAMQDDVIDLGCAAPGAPAVFAEAVAAAVAELPRYSTGPGYDAAGLLPLRQAIADRYAARGLPTSPAQIIVTTGAQQALSLLLDLLISPGDAVQVESPTYPHALDAVRRAGARLVPAGVNGGWDVELAGGSLRQAAVRLAYLIPDFQNPTGHLMSGPQRAAVLEAARYAGAQVIADETFAELPIDSPAMPAPLASYDTGGRVISVGSAAKLFWGGLRIGWIRATIPMAARLAVARGCLDIASPVLEQLIVVELLARVDEVRAQRAAELAASRDALAAALRERLPDWEFPLPRGGMSIWARLPAPVAAPLAEAGIRHGVRTVPGPAFGADGMLDDYLRLPYVLPPDVLREAVERLAAAARDVESAPPHRSLPAYV
ncbi:MAG: transcriptional regulator, GntR family with aminotransferase domain [Actinomycetia bacterium]|nr:transcriptional regulator, GntR family with aminotransferase domain [Actinomycetes bacterium]